MENTFVMFGSQHLFTMFLIVLISAFLPIFVKKYISAGVEFKIRMGLAAFLWIQESSIWIYRSVNGIFTIQENLPLHLCGFSVLLLPILLYTKKEGLYQILYFWGIGGATQALLTPTLNAGFPDYLFIQFFTAHGGIILAVIYSTVIFEYKPNLKGLFNTAMITVGLLFPIGLINWLIGSNYFFIAHKPDSASLLDFLGPWPFYLIPLIGVGVLIFLIVYIPFPIIAMVNKRNSTS